MIKIDISLTNIITIISICLQMTGSILLVKNVFKNKISIVKDIQTSNIDESNIFVGDKPPSIEQIKDKKIVKSLNETYLLRLGVIYLIIGYFLQSIALLFNMTFWFYLYFFVIFIFILLMAIVVLLVLSNKISQRMSQNERFLSQARKEIDLGGLMWIDTSDDSKNNS